MNKFSDFATGDSNLLGTKVSMNDIMGKEIAIWAYRIFPSRHMEKADCMQLQFDLDGEQCVAFTSSSVLIRQMKQYEQNLPFTATIVKRRRYFTFS